MPGQGGFGAGQLTSPSGPSGPSGPPSPPGPRLVGRDREVALLKAALDRSAVVLIEGEAGIGKTRLLREFLVSRTGRGLRTLTGTCPELRVPHTLGAVVDAVRDGVVDVAELGLSGLGGALRPLFPEWAAELPAPPEPLQDPTAARHRLFRAFAEILTRLEGAVLVLEDVHWADEATLEFLLFLVSRRPLPVRLVATYRRDEVPLGSALLRLSSRPPADAHLTRLTLEPLEPGDTAALVSSMLAGEQVSTDLTAFLHERTAGIPLVVEESVRFMLDRGDLVRHGGGWTRRRTDRCEVPPTVRDAVLQRAGRLGPDPRTVLYAMSVLAAPADLATLTAVTGLAQERFAGQVAEALGCGLLRESGPGQWSFRHPTACQAVHEAVPSQERRVMHLRAGRALERWPVPPVERLARHFRLAGDAEASSKYTERAAGLSARSGDVATAALLLHDLVTTVALPAEELVRLVAGIQFQTLPGSDPHSEVIDSLRSALATQALTSRQEASVRFQIGRVLMVAGEIEAGRLEVLRAVPHLAVDSPEAARARTLLALPLGKALPASEHLKWLYEAPAVVPSIAPGDRLLRAVEHAFALLMLGEEAGWAAARTIPDEAAGPEEASVVATGHANVGEEAMRWGRYDEAGTRLARSLALAERYGLSGHLDSIAATRAHLDWFTGTWTGLADRTARLLDDDSGVRLKDRCEAALVAGLVRACGGEREEAGELLRFAARDDQQRFEAAAALARLALRDGDVDEALRLTEEPAAITVDGGIWPRAVEVAPVRVSALLAADRDADAARLAAAFARAVGDRDAPAARASVVTCRALLAEALGRAGDAEALFAEAAQAWGTLPRPYDVLLARERRARCLLVSGRQDAGVRMLSEVSRQLAELGARDDAARSALFLNARGWDARKARGRGRPSYGDQLSPRELAVTRLLARGRTNRQISEALTVSTQTVASQVKSAMRKLRVTSRTALAIRLVELGLVDEQTQPAAGDE
ncbi:helix-turn-helix transcriptional regulator [Streptomyces sp. NPDC057621]|uniref:helix-turn-helix transcriptional regulator n=1 Tax=Streptomyces sp. NPDC057621 TaxID=3346186 RepID=UPI0036920E2D